MRSLPASRWLFRCVDPQLSGRVRRFPLPEISAWQGWQDSLKSALPDVLAGCWHVCARIPKENEKETFPFRTFQVDGSKGGRLVASEEGGQGQAGLACLPRSCPRLQAPEISVSFQWLNRMACIDG